MKKKLSIILLVAIILILIIGIIIYKNINQTKKEEEQNFKIVTTFYPIYIMTANITQGAENIELTNMTDVNTGCLHNYTLSTSDMKKIENADVIIQNGIGLESFMDKILNTYSNVYIIDSSKNITNKIEENGEINGHIWTSISNYMLQVEEITDELIKLNPENELIYKTNKEEYIQKLEDLQLKYNNEINLKGTKAVCLNEALTYFAKEIGLDVISVETDHEESSLSAEQVKNLINKIKEEEITMILVDVEDNLSTAETLANETGAIIYKLNSCLTGNKDLNAYIEAMESNLYLLIAE